MRIAPIFLLLAACAAQPPVQPAPAALATDRCAPDLPRPGAPGSGSNIQPPKLIRKVDPPPPNLSGTFTVVVEAVIDETGHVAAICRVEGDPRVTAGTVAAFRQWVFEPATLDGRPVKVLFSLTTRFHR